MQNIFKTDSSIFVIDGRNCANKTQLIQEFSTVFKFPDYVTDNWDSFDEVINDLSWISENNLIVYIKYFDVLLIDSETDKSTFFSILATVADETFKAIEWIRD